MAQGDSKAKKSNGGGQQGSGKKGSAKASAGGDSHEGAAAAKKPAESKPAHGGGHGAKGHDGHKAQIREYFVIFAVLFVLTVLEVAVAQIPGVGKTALTIALIGLALAKAACVGLFYMHLKHETRILRLTVALPMVFPALYAVVLIGEAAWRLTR